MSGTLRMFLDNQQRMGLQRIYRQVHSGLQSTKGFLGNAYAKGSRFLSNVEQYAGVARNVIGAVAPMVGSMSGPVGQAVGAAVGGGMKALGVYDRLKTETMTQANQIGNVAAAASRGLR
jgi:hypothetical protein